MRWRIDEYGRLIISVAKKEQRSLMAAQRRDDKCQCDPPFDSDAFMYRLLEPMVANDEFTWLHDGITDDLTSAPMMGVLGNEMPGPDDTQDAIGMGLVHVGCWTHEGRPRQMYKPVLRRWAFMAYQVTSPQRELAESGKSTWDGGDLWSTQGAAEKAIVALENCHARPT